MRAAPQLPISQEQLAEFCRRWDIVEMDLFGSAARGELRPDSDIDVLVTFKDSSRWGIFDLIHMEDDLAGLVNRPVDLVERRDVEASENYIRRRAILDSAVPVYVESR